MYLKVTNRFKEIINILTYLSISLTIVAIYFLIIYFSQSTKPSIIFISFSISLFIGWTFITNRKKMSRFIIKKITKLEENVKDEKKRELSDILNDITGK